MDTGELEAEVLALRTAVNENAKVLSRLRQTLHGDSEILADGLVARVLALSQKVEQSRDETYSMIQRLTDKIEQVVDSMDREEDRKTAIQQNNLKWLKIGAAILGSGQLIQIAQTVWPIIEALK
jgi:Mg2+ and Co2+ transporter CorA